MKQIILHFSDIHLRETNNPILDNIEKIVASINPLIIDISDIFLVVSGDISFSGTSEEYEIAKTFFNELRKQINERYKLNVKIYFSPGNHDRNFKDKKENEIIRKLTLEGIQKNENDIDDGVVNIMTEIQNNFFDFQKEMSPKPTNTEFNKLINVYKIELSNDKNITLYSYNSAWISVLKEDPGKLIFPVNYINKNLFDNKSDLFISIIHHPFNWNTPQNSRELINHLKSTSDFILTGHEHEFSRYLNDHFDGNYTEFIEAGALQDENLYSKSSFSAITIDFDKNLHIVNTFKFDGKKYKYINEDDSWSEIKRDKSLDKKIFKLNKSTLDFISRPGASFLNKRGTLLLRDIYVFPDLKVVDYKSNTSNAFNRFINSKKILDIDKNEYKVVFTGDERSGKTSLCKMIYKMSLDNEVIPIYIRGKEISNTSPKDINKLVHKLFVAQYDGDLDEFKQLDNRKKLIIIDDFDKSKLKHSHRNNFLKNISNIYSKIIVTGTDLVFLLDFISKEKDTVEELKSYNHFEIIQFGPKLRDKLIRKWLNINIDDVNIILGEDTYKELDYISNSIKTVIGKNFIPSYPFFLLTLLQAYEAGKQHDLSASQYGSYYELLINLSLHKISTKQKVITFYDNLLVEFCYYLFDKDISEVSLDKFGVFFEKFKNDYDIDNHFGVITILDNLIQVSILKKLNNQISINYNFIQFYYTAKYLRDNLHSEDEIHGDESKITNSKEIIKVLIENIHNEDYANILMFLTHLSNDPLIYNLLRDKAKSIFKEFDISRLENDIKEINNLSKDIPKLVLETKSIEEARKEKLEVENKIEIEEKYNSNNDDDDDDELELISQLNSAFKTIEITGQISRKYYAKIKANKKLELVQEVFELGFRTMHLFLSSIANNKEIIINDISSMIKEKMNKEEITTEIKKFLFYVSFIVGNGVIKKLSSSIGSSELSKTFERLEEILPYNSTYLVNNSIRLEFNKGFSISEIKDLKKILLNNPLAYTILKQQVVDYLYTFPIRREDKYKICSLLDIPIKDQLIIEETSRMKK